jgi:hypothetical protein
VTGLTSWCPSCLQPITVPLPCEPLYTMASAGRLIPTSEGGLRQLVFKHKHLLQPPIYRRHPRNPKLRIRFLYASDIVALRGVLFSNELHPKRKKVTA